MGRAKIGGLLDIPRLDYTKGEIILYLIGNDALQKLIDIRARHPEMVEELQLNYAIAEMEDGDYYILYDFRKKKHTTFKKLTDMIDHIKTMP